MSETMASKLYWDIYLGGNPKLKWAYAAEIVYPGYAIRLGTNGQIYLAKAGDLSVAGIMAKMPDHDVDAAYAIGDYIPYFPKGQDTDVAIFLALASPVVAIEGGEKLALSAVDGKLKKHVYTNAAEATDLDTNVIGHALEYDETHVTATHVIPANLSN